MKWLCRAPKKRSSPCMWITAGGSRCFKPLLLSIVIWGHLLTLEPIEVSKIAFSGSMTHAGKMFSVCPTCQACLPDSPDQNHDQTQLEILAQAALYLMSPMGVKASNKTNVNIILPPLAKMNENASDIEAVKMPELLGMTCGKDVEDFPNACSGVVPVQVTFLNPSMLPFVKKKGIELNDIPDGNEYIQRESKTYGMGMYFYSTYEEKTGKVREVIDLRFALGGDDLCSAEVRLTSGECFGMKVGGKPRAPADPPKPPALKDVRPELPQLHAKQVPGLGAGPIIVIVVLLLVLLVGGLAFFSRRQRLIQEERALRGAQEVEVN